MANISEKERIIKLFAKQKLEEKREILAELIKDISTLDESTSKDIKISKLTKELDLYKKQTGSAIKDWVEKEIAKGTKKEDAKEEEK